MHLIIKIGWRFGYFLFFPLGGGEAGVRGAGRGGEGGFLLEIPEGGESPGGWGARGREGVCGELGGAQYFFSGPKFPPSKCHSHCALSPNLRGTQHNMNYILWCSSLKLVGARKANKLNFSRPKLANVGPLFGPKASPEKVYVGPVLRPFPGNEADELSSGAPESGTDMTGQMGCRTINECREFRAVPH